MKKKLLSLVLTGICILSLAACSKSNPPEQISDTSNTEKTENTSEPVNLTLGIWDVNQKTGMEKMMEDFTSKNPNIKVEVQVTPWDEYWTKMEAAATGGVLPDVFWMHTNEFAKYAGNGMLMPLDNIITKEEQANYSEGLVSLATYSDGTLYGVPKDFDTIALMYNKELFDAAGVSYPDDTWTWDTLLDAAKKITNPETKTYGFLAPLEDQVGYLPWIYQAGGTVLENKKSGINSPEAIRGLQFYTDLILKEQVSPTLAEMSDTHFMSIFQSGRAGMCLIGSWQLATYAGNEDINDKFDLAVLPKDKERATMINGLSFAGNAKTDHKQEVETLLKYLGSEEAQIIQAESGTAISAFHGTSEKWLGTYPQYNTKVFLDMVEYATPVPTSNTKSKWNEVVTDMIKKMLMGEISVEEGTTVIAENMDKQLAKE
ncbi:MAG: ABC transporter substrate-binding protein [Anaerocolumna sp.]